MKIAIAQSGPARVGKTSTIRLFYNLLRAQHPNAVIEHELDPGKDFRAVVNIGRAKVGIESVGDPGNKRQAPSLKLFARLNCVAIVCACRTRGQTVEAVQSLEGSGYQITWRSRTGDAGAEHHAANSREAAWMLKEVEAAIRSASA